MPTDAPESRQDAGSAALQANRTAQAGPRIRWDDSNLKSSYANVCNVSTTREEVVLVFGINQAWERGNNEIHVQLTDRLILSPFAAKRLAVLLTNVITDYEKRFGTLSEPASPSM